MESELTYVSRVKENERRADKNWRQDASGLLGPVVPALSLKFTDGVRQLRQQSVDKDHVLTVRASRDN